jgi:hypothetical protein
MGIADKYYKRAMSINKCPEDIAYMPLPINPYLGVLFVCLVLIGVATVVFLVEVFVGRLQRVGRALERRRGRRGFG